MKNYRLKKEAVQFFKEDVATSIHDLDTWKEYQVDINVLEEVEDLYLIYRHESTFNSGNKGSSLSGWTADDSLSNQDKGSHFHFTIYFPSVKWEEHDKFHNGKLIRKLMTKIQYQLNNFYSEFVNNQE